jgi:tetratricopeptide (TPR) repeat protein
VRPLADLYLRDNRRDDAIASLNALAGQFQDNYLHQRRIAGSLAQRGLHEAAVERYKAILPLVKEEVDRRCEVLRELGQSYERLGKRDEAIAAYVEAVGLLASDHWLQKDLHERIVSLYRAANRLEDLATYSAAQIKRSPEQTAMRVLLADVQAAMGKPDLGKQTLAEAVELFPKDLPLSQKRVEFLERLGDIEGVSDEYQRIIGQHPSDSELYIAYGQSLAANRRVEAARNQWRHVLNTRVEDASLAVRLGALFEAYELYDDAAEAYERAITAAPKQPDAYTALSRLWLGRGMRRRPSPRWTGWARPTRRMRPRRPPWPQALRSLGKASEALDAITRASDIAPDQVRYQQIKSELLIQNGRLEEALDVRRAMIDKITNPVQQAEAIGTLVAMYASADKLVALKEQEEKRLAAKPQDIPALLVLARAADTQRDFPGMRARLDAILAIDPGHETALQQLAKLQDATGDINAAVETYTRLIQRTPARARQYYEATVDLKLRYADRSGAIETLQSMADGDPASAAVQSAVADQLVRMGDPERALKYFERALQVQPDRHETRLEFGKALVDAGRLEDALTAFRAVGTQRADTDRAFEAIGRMHDTALRLGRLEELIDELQQLVETDPQNTLVVRALAQLLIQELEYGRAMDMLDLAARNNPRDVDLALVRAEVLRRLGRYEEAAEGYQKVLRFPQIDRDYVLGELGKTWFESGQVDQARRLWKQIQNKLYSGSLLKNNGLVEEAIATFEEGIRLKPDEFALHRNLIGALEAAGRSADALAAARRLLELDPSNTGNIERLAEAYLRGGDRIGASQIAGRLFSAGVGADRTGSQSGSGYQSLTSAMYQAASAQMGSMYSSYGQNQARSNMDRAVAFFTRNGLQAELEEILTAQIAAQPDNAVLKHTAAELFSAQLNKPEQALALLRQLETATFPIEHQSWLGQCSQRDWMRIQQYNLIASKPALRDTELAALESKKAEELGRDQLLELAAIRNAQGNTEQAVDLLQRAIQADPTDTLSLGVLTDLLVAGEKFADAEPHARRLAELLGERREKMHADTVERVRRDYTCALCPSSFSFASPRPCSRTSPTSGRSARAGRCLTLNDPGRRLPPRQTDPRHYLRRDGPHGGGPRDLARPGPAPRPGCGTAGPCSATPLSSTSRRTWPSRFYQQALTGAKALASDPLLRQVYSSAPARTRGTARMPPSTRRSTASSRSSPARQPHPLYDFLRDTPESEGPQNRRTVQARRCPQGEVRAARQGSGPRRSRPPPRARSARASSTSPRVCKLAELTTARANWDEAKKVYEAYLADFPDELGLLTVLVRGRRGPGSRPMSRSSGAARSWSARLAWPRTPRMVAARTDSDALASAAAGCDAPGPLRHGTRDGRATRGGTGRRRNDLERWPSCDAAGQAELGRDTPNTIARGRRHPARGG